MDIVSEFANFFRRLFSIPEKSSDLSNAQLLLDEFRSHDFFLNESQKISKVGSWIWDIKTDKIQWSDYLAEIFGVTDKKKPTSYRDYLNYLPANERDYVHTAISEAFQQQKPFAFEHHLATKTGDVRTLNCHGKVVVENGEVKAMIGTSQDVTEQKMLESDLKRKMIEAESSNLAKSQFLANMSHEIRTPISAILGFSELLSDPNLSTEIKSSYLSLIRTNANWLTELVENILDLSKIESGKIESERLNVDLVPFLMSIRDLVANSSNKHTLPLDFKFKGKIPRTIATDPTRLRQILINIIRNAQKFTRTGKIVMRVCFQKSRRQPKLLFDICDTGIGMTVEQQKKVFEAFTQADTSTTRQFGGTGLGLTLAKRLSKVLGGDVIIKRSRPGLGTIFRVELPVTDVGHSLIEISELPKSKTANGHESQYLLSNRNILLVDDSGDNREIIKRFLEKAGAHVETAENGQAALQRLSRQHFDLVLMDLQMPVMDGLQATREIRKRDATTPIVALTAHALQEEKQKCLSAGFDDYLTKPINRNVLLEHVSQELEQSRLH